MRGSTSQNTFYFYRGRVALYALLRALNIKPGDEVILQAFTCLAVPSPIVGLGLRPVYVDIDPKTYNLDVGQMESRVTERAKVIIVQHTFGIPAPMETIMAAARKHNLVVIEDCCQVLGSRYRGAGLGCIGDAAFYSYEWGKPIIIGLGGAAVVHSEAFLSKLRALYDTFVDPPLKDVLTVHLQYFAHAALRRPSLFWTIREIYRALSRNGLLIGTFPREEFSGDLNEEYQRRMAPSLRARLAGKLPEAEAGISYRKWVGAQYQDGLRQLGIQHPESPAEAETVYLRYPLLVRNKLRVLGEARKWKVELGDWFTSPVHPLTHHEWKSVLYERGCCPIAEDTCQRIVTLPLHGALRQADIDRSLEFLRCMQERDLI
jgi:dTDP-4-amino-4,6-dideoxygalactose transaminase